MTCSTVRIIQGLVKYVHAVCQLFKTLGNDIQVTSYGVNNIIFPGSSIELIFYSILEIKDFGFHSLTVKVRWSKLILF